LKFSLRDAGRPSGAAPLIPLDLDAVLVLLRHGQTEFIVQRRFQGQMETPLTATGEAQARLAAQRLARPTASPPLPIPDTAPFLIVSSPLGRARRSADLVAEAMGGAGRPTPPVRLEPGLSEISQGEWEGLTDEEITARFGDNLGAWRRWPTFTQAPGGETLGQVNERVEAALARLLNEMAAGSRPGTLDRHQVLGYEDDTTDTRRWAIMVGHGGVFRVVVCALLGLPLEHFWNFDFGLASISVVEIRAGRAVLRALNVEPHLDAGSEGQTPPEAGPQGNGAL
jgi:broad specificity phosphatase PhoE